MSLFRISSQTYLCQDIPHGPSWEIWILLSAPLLIAKSNSTKYHLIPCIIYIISVNYSFFIKAKMYGFSIYHFKVSACFPTGFLGKKVIQADTIKVVRKIKITKDMMHGWRNQTSPLIPRHNREQEESMQREPKNCMSHCLQLQTPPSDSLFISASISKLPSDFSIPWTHSSPALRLCLFLVPFDHS